MVTVRHIERLWNSGKYLRLLHELIAPRVESLAAVELINPASAAPGAAALAMIRLDELNQPHAAICPKLIRAIAGAQEADGGWGDAVTTALCLRALALRHGDGVAIDRALIYMRDLQQDCGAWPTIPLRRMAPDALASAFVMLQLGDNERFRNVVRFDDAVAWFNDESLAHEPAAQTLWNHAKVRCGPQKTLFDLTPIWS